MKKQNMKMMEKDDESLESFIEHMNDMNEKDELEDSSEGENDDSGEGCCGCGCDMDELMEIAKKSYSQSETYFEKTLRPEIDARVRQFNGQHPKGSKYHHTQYKHQSKNFNNKTATVVRKHEAAAASAMFSTKDVAVVEPLNYDDDVSVAAAAYYSELLNIRLNDYCNWFGVFQSAYQSAMVHGWAIGKVDWDYSDYEGDEKPLIKLLEPENVRLDPTCDWSDPINSSPYIIELIEMEAGKVVELSNGDGWIPITLDDVAKHEGISENELIRMARETNGLDPKQEISEVIEHRKVSVHLNILRVGGKDLAFYSLGDSKMLSEPVEVEDMFPHEKRPYVFGKCIVDAHKVYPRSVVSLLKDYQSELNDMSNLRLDNVRHAIHGRTFIKRGQNVDLDSLKLAAPGSITMLNDPQNDVNFTRPPDVTNSSYKETELINLAMDDLSGVFTGTSVQGSRMVSETVGGPSLLSSNASQVSEYQLITFNKTFTLPMLTLVLESLMNFEDNDDVITMALRRAVDKNPDMVLHDTRIFTEKVKLSVNVGMGNVNPVAKLEKFRMGMQAILSVAPSVSSMLDEVAIAEEVFGIMGFDNGRRFFKGGGKEDPRIQQMQEKISQLESMLQAKKPQELIDAEVELKKAQAVKTKVEATFGAMQAGESIAVMPAVAPIGDKLLQTSGWVNAQGQDPNFPMTAGQAGVSDDQLKLAQEQAASYRTPQNPDQTEPATGQRGISTRFSAGITGVKDRDA